MERCNIFFVMENGHLMKYKMILPPLIILKECSLKNVEVVVCAVSCENMCLNGKCPHN